MSPRCGEEEREGIAGINKEIKLRRLLSAVSGLLSARPPCSVGAGSGLGLKEDPAGAP